MRCISHASTALLVLLASPVLAQDNSAATHFYVTGIADNDLLNIRASASAGGMVVGRLPNGARLKNLGCEKVKNYDWCKVQDLDNPSLSGWTPSRYLQGAEIDEAALPQGEPGVDAPVSASAQIPCAREFGAPMTMCNATVVREGEGAASVTVTWPDGEGTRVIDFREGKPDSSDSADNLRFTREADLNMIRIGKGERFEIADELALGG